MQLSDDLKKKRFHVLWAAQRSQRYHARRSYFFNRWNKATALFGVLAGSTVVASVTKAMPEELAGIAAFIVVFFSGVDLVAGTGDMARRHDDLRRRFCHLEAEIARNIQPDEQTIAGWHAQRLQIEADEPPPYVALSLLCENELQLTYDHLKDRPLIEVNWWYRNTAHLFMWENLQPKMKEQQRNEVPPSVSEPLENSVLEVPENPERRA